MAEQPADAMRQREAARQDDEEATQQPAGATKRVRGRRGAQQEDKERRCDNKLAQQVEERVAQREDGERQCENQLSRQEGSAMRGRQEAMQEPAGATRR